MLFGQHILLKLNYHLQINFESYIGYRKFFFQLLSIITFLSIKFIHKFNETSTAMNVTKGNLLNYLIEQITNPNNLVVKEL